MKPTEQVTTFTEMVAVDVRPHGVDGKRAGGGRWWPVKEGLFGKLLRATSGALADLRMGTRQLNKTRRLNLVETTEGVHLGGRESG